MIKAGNERTSRFLERLREEADRLKDLRRKAKKDRFPMRLAYVKYHRDGSVTKIWRVD